MKTSLKCSSRKTRERVAAQLCEALKNKPERESKIKSMEKASKKYREVSSSILEVYNLYAATKDKEKFAEPFGESFLILHQECYRIDMEVKKLKAELENLCQTS